jgi:hypothetical protein
MITQSKAWVELTLNQRLSWENFAVGHKKRNVFGLQKKRTGQQMFMFINLALESNGLNTLADPPTDLDVTSLTSIGLANGTSGVVSSANVTAGGTGYTAAPTIAFSGGGGSGAAGTVQLAPTGVASVTIGAGGTGYTTPPAVTFTGGGGSGAVGTAVLTANAVSSVTITSAGTGYTSAPTVGFTGGGGTGATGTAVLTAAAVQGITITSQGTGYTSAPTIAFSGGGGGSGAAATAVFTLGTTALSMTFSPGAIATDMLEVWATPIYSAGKTFVRNLFRYLDTYGPGVTSPLDLTDQWISVFGDLPSETPYKISIEANYIRISNGARSGKARGDLYQS